MKRILIIAFLFFYSYSNSQTNGIIEVNPNKKVFIFFKSKIVKGVSVPNRTLFEFDKEKGSSIGTVMGEKNRDSNLLVTTADGLTYSFSLKYTKRVGKLNYFIEKNEATNYTKDMEIAANNNKEMTIDESGLIVMKRTSTTPKVEIEVEDTTEEEEALAAARLEKENLEKEIKEEAAALKKAVKEKAREERAVIAEKRKAEKTIKSLERKKEKGIRDAERKKEKELQNLARENKKTIKEKARKKEKELQSLARENKKALKEAARKKEEELKQTEREEIAAHKEELALKAAAKEKEAALEKIEEEKEVARKAVATHNKEELALKEEARKEEKAIEDATYKEELALKEAARKEEKAIEDSIEKEALALNKAAQEKKEDLEEEARKKEKALKKSERKKKRAVKNSERDRERKMREELEKNRRANKAAKKKRGNVVKVADTKEEEATIIKDQGEVQKQLAIPKGATDVTIGMADGGFGLNLSYNKMLKKGYLKYGLNGAFSKMKSSLTKQDVSLSVYTFDLGYFIPLVHKTKVNFAIGGGGLLGYETIKNGDDIEINAKNNFVYGAYIGTEFAYRFTDKVGLLLKYNQNFYLNSDIGNTAPYMGVGLRFYTNKRNN